MEAYTGKVMLLVNSASNCGFAPQSAGLEELYQTYRAPGFMVVGFPGKQFRGKDPGGRENLERGCRVRFGVTFPVAGKAEVRGENVIPLFRHLTSRR